MKYIEYILGFYINFFFVVIDKEKRELFKNIYLIIYKLVIKIDGKLKFSILNGKYIDFRGKNV